MHLGPHTFIDRVVGPKGIIRYKAIETQVAMATNVLLAVKLPIS